MDLDGEEGVELNSSSSVSLSTDEEKSQDVEESLESEKEAPSKEEVKVVSKRSKTSTPKSKSKVRVKRKAVRSTTDQDTEEVDQVDGDEPAGHEVHILTRKKAIAQEWPDGPTSMKEIASWAFYNADQLPSPSTAVLQRPIYVTESYAGTWNGAVSLHKQWKAMQMTAEKHSILSAGHFGKVVTDISCDIDPLMPELS